MDNLLRGGSRIFFRRGCTRLLLYFNINKPHSFFFWQNTSCIRKPQVISGGVRTPCTLPLDLPLLLICCNSYWWRNPHEGGYQYQYLFQGDWVWLNVSKLLSLKLRWHKWLRYCWRFCYVYKISRCLFSCCFIRSTSLGWRGICPRKGYTGTCTLKGKFQKSPTVIFTGESQR